MLKSYARGFLDFILFSNLFIALCAIAQGALTYALLNMPAEPLVLAVQGCATFAYYNLSILLARPAQPAQSPYRRTRWVFRHERLMTPLTVLATTACLWFSFQLRPAALLVLIPAAALALLYSLPLWRIKDRKWNFRQIPGLKLFLIALVWTLSCVALPLVILAADGIHIPAADSILLLTKRFLFITAITLPFDIRDFLQDKQYGLKTIPVLLGQQKAYQLCLLLLSTYLLLLFIFNQHTYQSTPGLVAVTLLTAWLIFRSRWEKNEYYYFLCLDGTLILQFLAVWLFSDW